MGFLRIEQTPKISRSAKTLIGVYCVPHLCTQGVSSKRLDVAEVSGENRVAAGALVSSSLPGSCPRAVPDLHGKFSESYLTSLTSVFFPASRFQVL